MLTQTTLANQFTNGNGRRHVQNMAEKSEGACDRKNAKEKHPLTKTLRSNQVKIKIKKLIKCHLHAPKSYFENGLINCLVQDR